MLYLYEDRDCHTGVHPIEKLSSEEDEERCNSVVPFTCNSSTSSETSLG